MKNMRDAELRIAYYTAAEEDTEDIAREIVRRVELGIWDLDDSAPADAFDEIGA